MTEGIDAKRQAGRTRALLARAGLVVPRSVWAPLLALLAVAGFSAIVPLFPNYAIRVVDSVLIYIVLGVALNIVVGYAGLLDLGFIAFYAIGAYAYAFLASTQFDIHMGFLPVMAIGSAAAGLAGILLGIPVLKLRGDYLVIVTLGFGEIIRLLLNNADALTNGPQGIAGIDRATMFGLTLRTPLDYYYLLLILVLVTIALAYRLERSILGVAWRSIRADQDASRGLGVDTAFAKLCAFAISAAIAGAAGTVFSAFQRFVTPESFQLWESILILLIIIIGGVGNIVGVIVGAIVLIVVPEFFRDYASYRMLLDGLLLISLVILRPEGLIPRKYDLGWLFGWDRVNRTNA